MKKITDYLIWAAIAVMGIYLLYQKGFILADYESLGVQQAYEILKNEESNVTLLDVRTQEEFDKDGRLNGALLIPVQLLEQNINRLEGVKDKKILVYCRSGNRSVTASRILSAEGFHVYNVKGGIIDWKAEGLPFLE